MQVIALGNYAEMYVPDWERDFDDDSVNKSPGIVGKGDGRGGDGSEEKKDKDDIPVPQIETCLITEVTPLDTARSTHKVPWLVFSLSRRRIRPTPSLCNPTVIIISCRRKKLMT